ncbi:GDSL-type esterase/lipase family protein [Bifidobacterium amazonense]|uniref:GDSL-type esterase/lipase family protein n=1 Tax=Bifidobacterium amazonense TaxID=2809027 RepID=A0ABS9VV43_9BIFI|nr:GDSL-type esterase/lipase family protein [Bifidobacterium amazonense]MCH9275965.1 GDSL-type esterase/lipase family protein [Bifidobacterium amazonense]
MTDSNDARVIISPADPALRTMGRIDDADPTRPIWVYPYTQVAFRFTGTSLAATLVNRWNYGDTHLGVIIDGVQAKVRIPSGCSDPDANADYADGDAYGPVTVTLAENLPDIEHEAVVFKRQDGEHYVELHDFRLDPGARVLPPLDSEPNRRIEVFGDSVSCGERNEAALYVGRPDPEVDLSSYSNAWQSYAAITARNLGAALHDVSQGGASLIDGIGWFYGPDYVGQESIWDRIEYNPALGATKPWDFSRYTPQVVIVAVGQNDAHPVDFMAEDYRGEQAMHWRARYVGFLKALHERYPHATIICTTTVLRHDPAWDRAIDEAVYTFNADLAAEAQDLAALCQLGVDSSDATDSATDHPNGNAPVAYHFLYSRNGSATPGHPRVAEHEEMARELTAFIESLGEGIWEG